MRYSVRLLVLVAVLLELGVSVVDMPTNAQEVPPPAKITVTGMVCDASGKPIADVRVVTRNLWTGGELYYEHFHSSDHEGRFEFSMEVYAPQVDIKYVLWAVDEKQANGAYLIVTRKTLESPLSFKLQPLYEVSATVACEEVTEMDPWNPPFVIDEVGGSRWVAVASTEKKTLKFKLPKGEYRLSPSYGDHDWHVTDVKFTVQSSDLKLAEIKIELSEIARRYGKEPPGIAVSDVRNLPADLDAKGTGIKLSDFKGRWVLIEFWGWW